MKKLMAFLRRVDRRHYVCIGITIALVALLFFVFFSAFPRVAEACVSFGTSIAFYFCELLGIRHSVTPVVTQMPESTLSWFPATVQGLKEDFVRYWQLFVRGETVVGYFRSMTSGLEIFAKVLLLLVPVIVLFIVLTVMSASKRNCRHGADTRPLRIWKRVTSFYPAMREWLRSFAGFIGEHRVYCLLWLFLIFFMLNGVTIVLEALSFYFYFVVSYDVSSIFTQLYKLLVDLTPAVMRVPFIVWLTVGLWLFFRWRSKVGYRRLQHREMNNRGFINERPIVTLFVGTMGAKKTTTLTDFALSREVMFKDKAFELMLENDMKFPYFPWIVFEMELRRKMDAHEIYNLASIKAYVRGVARCFYLLTSDPAAKRAYLRYCRRRRLVPQDFIYGYDWQRYGLFHHDGLKEVYLFDVLENYAQEYFIYVIQSSLIVSNYAIRSDLILQDEGNFPLWDTDFFKRDARLMDSYSRHSHILDFDVLRLGKKVIEHNPLAGSFEFGVVAVTEFAKERGNQLTNKKYKSDDERANPLNDQLESQLKMFRHAATVDNYPFICFLSDDQRAMSLNADARELFDIVHIRKTSEFRLHLPFFFVEEFFYYLLYPRFRKKYTVHRFRRGDNTLLMYLQKSLVKAVKDHYDRICNTFGYYVLDVGVEDGAVEGVYKDAKIYLSTKKAYSRRFATDCFSDYFNERARAAGVGIEDYLTYETERARLDELERQHSYFIATIMRQFERMGEK